MAIQQRLGRHTPQALTIYADADLFEVFCALLYNRFHKLLSLSLGPVRLKIPCPPRVRLSAENTEHDLTLIVPIELGWFGKPRRMKLYLRGWLSVEKGVAQLGKLALDMDVRRGWNEKLINRFLDRVLENALQGERQFQLPELHKVFGRDLDARLANVHVRELFGRPYFCVMATVGRPGGGLRPAPIPRSRQLKPPPEGVGSLVAVIPERILTTTLNVIFPGYTHVIRTRLSAGPARLRVKGSIVADPVDLALEDGEVQTRIHVRFRKIKAGLRMLGCNQWIRLRVKVIKAGVDVSFNVSDNHRRATLVVDKVNKIKARLKSRRRLEDFGSDRLKQLLDDATGAVTRVLRDRLNGARIRLIDLPETFPGTNLPVKARLGHNGLAVREGAIIADLQMGIDFDAAEPSGRLPETPGYWDYQSIEGIDLHLRQRGEGQSIVFIHDLGLDLHCWRAQLDYFARRYQPLVYEWRGMGHSRGGKLPRLFSRLVKDLRGLLREMDVDEPVLCGQGMGAEIALRYPDVAHGLVIVGSAGGLMTPAVPVRPWRLNVPRVRDTLWSESFQQENPDYIARWEKRFRNNSVWRMMLAKRASVMSRSSWKKLPALELPILVIRGAGDAKGPGNLEECVLAEPSNMPMVEQSLAFNTALEQFLIPIIKADQRRAFREALARRGSG